MEGVTLAFQEYKQVTSSTDPDKAKDLSKFGKGTTDLLDILKEIRQKKKDDWKDVNTLVNDYGDWFLDWTDRVKLPEWFDPEKEDVGQAVKLLDWMLDMAAVLYVESDQVNDFFYLHGITGTADCHFNSNGLNHCTFIFNKFLFLQLFLFSGLVPAPGA